MLSSNRNLFILCCIAIIFNCNTQVIAQPDSIAILNQNAAGTGFQSGKSISIRYKPQLIAKLTTGVKETSGLIFSGGQLWTINDSGNPPEIIQIDTITGSIVRKVVIANAVNRDWESITQDDSTIYIGDFGNNYGNRKDLHILKIVKTDLFNPANDTVPAGYIYFSYPDQTDFSPALNRNNFDCEAFFCHNDSLHLFSKDWGDQLTRHYVVPSDTGRYQARYIEKFGADGLITDASINEQGNIVLLGYKNTGGRFWDCFSWLLYDYKGCNFFSGRKTRLELGSALQLGQSEGIVLKNNNTGWISSESIFTVGIFHPAKLFSFDFNNFFPQGNSKYPEKDD